MIKGKGIIDAGIMQLVFTEEPYMRVSIENEQLKAEFESFGAELKSIVAKNNHQEYMWEADPAFWGKTSPILFPFIGKLEGGSYCHGGTVYGMDKHGFARDMDYRVVGQEQDRVVFAIESTEETLEKFPFPFLLEVEYRLEENRLSEQWRVRNTGSETMYFSMGGHPAFACPLVQNGMRNGKRTDCFVKLYGTNDTNVIKSAAMNVSTGLLTGSTFSVNLEKGIFPVTEHIFDNDALIFAGQGVTAVGLLNREGREYIRLEAESCPVWGIWSMPTADASYVCIEPWWGICDSSGYSGTLQERPYTNHVEAGEVWQDGFRIVVEG